MATFFSDDDIKKIKDSVFDEMNYVVNNEEKIKENLKAKGYEVEEKTARPKFKDNIDIKPLKEIIEDYCDFIDSEDYNDDSDYRYYIYETAIDCMFGNDVFWDWKRKVTGDEGTLQAPWEYS